MSMGRNRPNGSTSNRTTRLCGCQSVGEITRSQLMLRTVDFTVMIWAAGDGDAKRSP